MAGHAFVLYETDKKEVTACLLTRRKHLRGGDWRKTEDCAIRSAAGVVQSTPQAQISTGGGQVTIGAQVPVTAAAPIPFFPSVTGGSEVYPLRPMDRRSRFGVRGMMLVYSLGFAKRRQLLLGTGNHGNVIELEGERIFSITAIASSDQVTSLVPGAGGAVYVAPRIRESIRAWARAGKRWLV